MHFNITLFASAIRQKRAAGKIKLRDVAQITGLSVSTLSRLENGKDHDISMTTFTLLCNWLKVDPGQFFVSPQPGVIEVTGLEGIEMLLRGSTEEPELCKAVAEVLRLIRERG